MMRALSPTLERRIGALAERSRIVPLPTRDNAPASLAELRASVRIVRGELRVPVWTGASDATIWSSPAFNVMFRAWHDAGHVLHALEFDAKGELALARIALRDIDGARDRRILWTETWGQVAHYRRAGQFPDDQRAFVRARAD